MTNEVATSTGASTAVAALQNLRAGIANVQQSIVIRGGQPFLRMEKDGTWVYGADDTEVEEGSRWAVNIFAIEHGYACWTRYTKEQKAQLKKKDELLGERMVPATQKKPVKETLPDHPFDWVDQISFPLTCLNGTDEGTEVLYKTTSVGGTNACNELLKSIMKQMDNDPEHPVPVLDLQNDSYPHKEYGKTYIPIFAIMQWVSPDAEGDKLPAVKDDAPAATAPTAAPAAEPARKRRSTARPAAAVPEAGAAQAAPADDMTVAVDPADVAAYAHPQYAELVAAHVPPEVALIATKAIMAKEAAAAAPAETAAAPATDAPAPARRRRAA